VKVLHAFKDAYPPTRGGVELHVHDITRSLDGFSFSVLTSSRSTSRRVHERLGVRFVETPERCRVSSAPVSPSWRKELRDSDVDLFHFHMPNPVGELALLASGVSTPLVASYHADPVRSPGLAHLYSPVQQRFLARADRILVASPMLAATPPLLHHRDRLQVVPYGFDPDRWDPSPGEIAEIRRRHPGPIVLFLGRLVWYKGVDLLIDAMRSVEGTLVVVGDGPKRAELEARAQRAGLGSRVVFPGAVSDRRRAAYYRAADVFVVPSTSRAEAFCLALLEAMAYGTPAISTEVGTATSWVNVAGETGMVVPPGDARALAGALDRLLGDEPMRQRFAEAAAARARSRFTLQAMLEAVTEVYLSTASGPRAHAEKTPAPSLPGRR
jgi:glycosyltransferase involved in cell wall biosynthesis